MQLTKRALLSAVVVAANSLCPLMADEILDTSASTEEEFAFIRKYIEEKRNISVKDKGGNLRIGGDVRVEYKRAHQVADGQRVESGGTGANRGPLDLDIPQYRGDVEASLSFEYVHDKSYADLLFKFSNHAGMDSTNYNDLEKTTTNYGNLSYKPAYAPSNNKIAMARAVIGSELWSKDSHAIVGEVGRQRLYDLFDSRVMFINRFDGVAAKYTGDFEGIGKAHATAGMFLIADRANHWGKAFQVGLSQILDTGFGLKYAFIKWNKDGTYSDGSNSKLADNAAQNLPTSNTSYAGFHRVFRFACSQILANCYLPTEWFGGRLMNVYAAWVHNHAAKTMRDWYGAGNVKDSRNNNAWYAGFTLGRIQASGDWVLDANYQYVEAQAVPEFEAMGGAGRGNLRNVWLFMDPSQGYTNFKGVRAQVGYCLTSDVMLNFKAASTRAASNQLSSLGSGAKRSSRNEFNYVEAEIVYSF
jgi:hypothetical protein